MLLHGYNLVQREYETGVFVVDDSVVSGLVVTREDNGDRTYTLRFDNSDEAVAITRLSRTALADIRKQINEFLKEVKNHEHE